MKDKEFMCPVCGNTCRYIGNRRFYCKKCKETYVVSRKFEPRAVGNV